MSTPHEEELGVGGRMTTGSDHQCPKTKSPDFQNEDGDPHLSDVRDEPVLKPKARPTPENLDDIVRRSQE